MRERIKEIIALIFGIEVTEVSDNASPSTMEAWDSLKHMKLVIALEEEFGVDINDDEIFNMMGVQAIEEVLRNKVK